MTPCFIGLDSSPPLGVSEEADVESVPELLSLSTLDRMFLIRALILLDEASSGGRYRIYTTEGLRSEESVNPNGLVQQTCTLALG